MPRSMDSSRFAGLVAVAINPNGVEINAQVVFCDPVFVLSFFIDISLLRKSNPTPSQLQTSYIESSPIISAVYP